MRSERTYADKGLARLVAQNNARWTKEQKQKGAMKHANGMQIGLVDGVPRADRALRKFSWQDQ